MEIALRGFRLKSRLKSLPRGVKETGAHIFAPNWLKSAWGIADCALDWVLPPLLWDRVQVRTFTFAGNDCVQLPRAR